MRLFNFFTSPTRSSGGEQIKLPQTTQTTTNSSVAPQSTSDHTDDSHHHEVDVVVIKIKNPKQMMETLHIVRDTVLDFISMPDLVLKMQFSCKFFKELVDSFIETRSAGWWSGYWKRTLMTPDHDSNSNSNAEDLLRIAAVFENIPIRFNFGSINSRTENTSTSNNFTASLLSIEDEKKAFPFILKSEELSDSSDSPSGVIDYTVSKPKPYVGTEKSESIQITNVDQVEKLLSPHGGIIFESTDMYYSSMGKSGSADGSFTSNFLTKKLSSTRFYECESEEGNSIVVTVAESSLRFVFWLILTKWWLGKTNQAHLQRGKLLLHTSVIKRKKQVSYDRYGPVNSDETIHLISIVHCQGKEVEEQQHKQQKETIIGTYVKHHSYYG